MNFIKQSFPEDTNLVNIDSVNSIEILRFKKGGGWIVFKPINVTWYYKYSDNLEKEYKRLIELLEVQK